MDQMPFRLEVNDLLYSDCSKGTLTEFSSPYKVCLMLKSGAKQEVDPCIC